jgi:hypothetical protein
MTQMNTVEDKLTDKITIIHEHPHGKIMKVDNKKIAIVTATSNYIPIDEFKDMFMKIGKLVEKEKIEKLIFDKRQLTVFHQPSMEWYFTIWKEEMWNKGLKTHRKILPDSKVFQQSVKIGREKIKAENPTLKFNKMDIQYRDDLQTAINE